MLFSIIIKDDTPTSLFYIVFFISKDSYFKFPLEEMYLFVMRESL